MGSKWRNFGHSTDFLLVFHLYRVCFLLFPLKWKEGLQPTGTTLRKNLVETTRCYCSWMCFPFPGRHLNLVKNFPVICSICFVLFIWSISLFLRTYNHVQLTKAFLFLMSCFTIPSLTEQQLKGLSPSNWLITTLTWSCQPAKCAFVSIKFWTDVQFETLNVFFQASLIAGHCRQFPIICNKQSKQH